MLAALHVAVWLVLAGFVALLVVVACWEARDARRAVDRWRARRAARRARARIGAVGAGDRKSVV